MDEDRYAELSERLDQLDLQLAVIVGILADNQQALLDKMEEISGRTPYNAHLGGEQGSYS